MNNKLNGEVFIRHFEYRFIVSDGIHPTDPRSNSLRPVGEVGKTARRTSGIDGLATLPEGGGVMDGLLLEQFRLYAYTVSPIKQLHSHPSILWVVGHTQPSHPFPPPLSPLARPVSLLLSPLFFASTLSLSSTAGFLEARRFHAIKKRACCSAIHGVYVTDRV